MQSIYHFTILCTHEFGDFRPFFSAGPLKRCQVGWGLLVDSHFQVSPEIFNWVQDIWLSHSRTFTELTQSHSCTVLAVCLGLLSCWKVNLQSRLWALWNRYFAPFSFPSALTSPPVPVAEQHPYWGDNGQVMSGAWFPPDNTLRIEARQFKLGFIRPDNLVSHSLRVL